MKKCPYCGHENEDGRIICAKCLKALEVKKEKTNRKIWIIVAAAIIVIAAVVTIIILTTGSHQGGETTVQPDTSVAIDGEKTSGDQVFFHQPQDDRKNTSDPNEIPLEIKDLPEEGPLPTPGTEVLVEDIDSFFSQHGEVINRIEANESENVHTGAEIVSDMNGRGLTQYPVTGEYSMSGQYSETTDVSADSDTKHPIYTTYYVASNGDLWTISEINGQVTAYPVTYNMNSGLNTEVIVAETNTIVSYDSGTNRFYETIPAATALTVKTVERIDAETLDRLSAEGVGSI